MTAGNARRRAARTGRGRPERVGEFLSSALRSLGIAERLGPARSLAAWRAAVGETIARRTETLGVRGGILWVAVDGSCWMQELAGRRREILARLAEKTGEGAIRDLRFVMMGSAEMTAAAGSLAARSDRREGDDGEERE
jgi:predicted nucleic acid-binding Zn ribbon protein